MRALLFFLLGVCGALLAIYVYLTYFSAQHNAGTTPVSNTNLNDATSVNGDGTLKVQSPKSGELITSPVKIKGEAKGWFFEGSFPVKLVDSGGNEIANGFVSAKGEWMVDKFVEFDGSLVFSKPVSKTGFLVFMADNPSGLPENNKEYKIPIQF